ncbi:MAG: aspartate carbamoyltransferase catalytic subunit [Clostridia bacterium]|nr:aspartate carbamoyltransferase catalytic subunit [Clostridia bacterium]MBP3422152.1 aspartate carbamoyltransferase catalytic subunit [Clostridia bacterium]
MLERKDLLGLIDASESEITEILDLAQNFKDRIKKGEKNMSYLVGKTATILFYENSTRTRTSFEQAAKYLGAKVINIVASTSSVAKGETLVDTGKTLDAQRNEFIVIRHSMGGAPHLLAKTVKASVLNAGDGVNEHPTQALLDMLTMRETFGTLKGLKVAILGDIKHSRVAKSNLFGLKTMGSDVYMYAPNTLIPKGIEQLGAKVCSSREEALKDADVVMGLRIQLERQEAGAFPSLGEYAANYGVNEELLALAKPNAIVLHPGPVNRGVELTSGVIDHERSHIEDQVLSGVAVRMAALTLLNEARKEN